MLLFYIGFCYHRMPSHNLYSIAAQEAMSNPKVMAIIQKAQKNPKVMQAVQECMGNPMLMSKYMSDPDVGPILKELQEAMM